MIAMREVLKAQDAETHTHTKEASNSQGGRGAKKYSEEKSRNPSGMALSLRLQSLAFN